MNYDFALRNILFFIFGFINHPLVKVVMGVSFFALLILLLINKSKFVYEDKPFTKKQKFVFISIFLVTILLNIGYFTYVYNKAYHPDNGYSEAVKKVNFHIYRPTYIPEGHIQNTKFVARENGLSDKGSYVRYTYNYPLQDILNDKDSALIITQSKVDFFPSIENLENYIDEKTSFKNYSEVKLDNWMNTPAILVRGDSQNKDPIHIAAVTPDKVLILVTSSSLETDEIIRIIDSME